jgi:exopolysaccharide biosynthesis polyprenyl glycosylphosphotransferase
VNHAYAPDASTPEEAKRFAALDRARQALGPGHRSRQALFEGSGWTAVRLVTDTTMLLLGCVAALLGAPAELDGVGNPALIWMLPPITLVLLAVRGRYGDAIHVRLIDGIGTFVSATSLAAIALIAGAALIDPSTDSAPLLARAWLFGTAYLVGGRVVLAWAQRRARANRLVARPTLIVGAGQVGGRVERRLREQPELGLLPIGYLDGDAPPAEMAPLREAPVLGAPEDIAEVARATGARHVVLGFSSAPDYTLIPFVRVCETLGLKVSLVPRLFDSVNVRVALDHLGGLPLYGLHSINPKGWQFTVKHVLDRIGAVLLLILLSPVLLALAIGVRMSSPGPVLFRQLRIGRDGREFEMFKFRSMRMAGRPAGSDEGETSTSDEHDNVVPLLTDRAPGGVEGADRRTGIGGFLRRSSLDELPQLLNVLRGEMSLVGPRPERPEFVSLFGTRVERYGDRHRVKSGMTGWAQVHGLRGQTSLQDRVEWDNYYIENWSLTLDFKVLLLTLAALFRRAE